MTTYNTGNPIGSTDARDRLDNSENMDIIENSTTLNAHPDRLGVMRKTRKGMELEHDTQIAAHETEHDAQMQSFENDFDNRLAGMAFTRVGTFTNGATLTDMRQTLLWEVSQGGDGREYGWTGSFLPAGKVVTAGSTPETSGGVSAGAWVDRTDDKLRDEVYTPARSPLISVTQRYTTEYVKSLADKVANPHVDLQAGTSLSYMEIIFPCTSFSEITIEVSMDVLGGAVGTDITFAATACTSLARENTVAKSTAYTYLGDGVYSVTLSGTPSTYMAFSVRAIQSTQAHVKIKSIKVRDNASSKLTYATLIDELVSSNEWKTSSDVLCDLTFGSTMRQIIQLSGSSFINSSGVIDLSPVGASDFLSSPYSFDFYLDNLASLGAKIGKTISLIGGDYRSYRRATSLPIRKDLNIIARNGKARILSGKEMKTSLWTLVQSSPFYVYSCPYDYDSNPDSAIRGGTKQPYVSCDIQQFKDGKSQLYYKLTPVASLADVTLTSRAVWYDYANKTLYFSFDAGNDSCYVWVCEADNGVAFLNPSSPYSVNSFNVEVIAPKVSPWKLSASSYVNGIRYNKHISLHYCSAIGGYSGAGFAFSNIDNEQIDCYASSNAGDGFNYHDKGRCYTKGGMSKCNGDDGISHHELCVGYVDGLYIQDNAAAYSATAYGAMVHHVNCIGIAPSSGLSAKNYSASFTSLAGQGSSSSATFESCKSFGGTNDYSAVSQQDGYTATLRIHKPTVRDDSSILSILKSGSTLVEYKP